MEELKLRHVVLLGSSLARTACTDGKGNWSAKEVFRRKPSEDKWTQRAAEMAVGVPWRTSDDDPKVDGESSLLRRSC